jgi:hypothetical protein
LSLALGVVFRGALGGGVELGLWGTVARWKEIFDPFKIQIHQLAYGFLKFSNFF